MIRNFN